MQASNNKHHSICRKLFQVAGDKELTDDFWKKYSKKDWYIESDATVNVV